MAQVKSCWPLIAEAQVRSQASPPRFVVDNGALDKFLPSVSFHQCSIFIFTLILLSSEGQMGEAWEPSNIAKIFGISEVNGHKSTFILIIQRLGRWDGCSLLRPGPMVGTETSGHYQCGQATWFLTFRKKYELNIYENSLWLSVPKKAKWRRISYNERHNSYSSPKY